MRTFIENRPLIGIRKVRAAILFLMVSAAPFSCQSNGPSSIQQREGKGLFGTSAPASAEESWSIVIVSYHSNTQATLNEIQNQAQLDLKRVRDVGLTDAYVQQRGERLVLAFGQYDSPNDTQALADLERIKELEWQGRRPFFGALLTPPSGIDVGTQPELNLLSVKQRYGSNAIYSLQIGVYGRADRELPTRSESRQFREAAEKGAVQLRREGELAFYYHGSHSSSVTVGVFGHEDYRIDFDDKGRKDTIRSRRLDAAQQRFPLLLLNGKTIRLPALTQGGVDVHQSTDLISIP